jgi:putative ABC transport system ATP-binding protein
MFAGSYPSIGSSDDDLDSDVSLLELVLVRLGATVSPHRLHDVRASERRHDEASGKWLVRATRELGLDVHWVRATVSEAATAAQKHGPMVGYAARERRFVAIVGRALGGLELLDTHGGRHEPSTVAPNTLATMMGAETPDVPLEWAVLEPRAQLGGPDDHEAAGAHGEHPRPERRLLQMLREEARDLRAVFIYAIAIGILSLTVPIAVQALVNSVAFGTVLQPVVVLTILVGAALAFDGVLRLLQATVVEWIQQRTFVRTAVEMARRLSMTRSDALGPGYAPELANRFFDVVTVQKSAAVLLLDGLALVLQTAIGMILLAFYHPLLLAFDAVLMLCIGGVVFGLGRGAIETSIKESKAKYRVAAWLEEIARHQTSFRSATSRRFALTRLDALATEYVVYRGKHWKVLARQILGTKMLQAFASAALLGVGGYLVIGRQLTLGQLIAAELIVTAVVGGVAKFGKHLESYYDLVAAVDKLGHVLDLPLEREGGAELPHAARPIALELRGVPVRGDRGGAKIQLRVESGARVSIRGPNGCGKSTLVDVLYGLSKPPTGVVLVDGADLRALDLEEYRAQVALVRGDEAFEGSIYENVRMGREIDDARVREALTAVGLLDEIFGLPDGIDTRLAPGGLPLSRGQTRRLLLARAIVDRPRLLVLDEALDGVDEAARRAVVGALFAADAPWTVLVTTHIDEVAALCDQQYVLDKGVLRLVSEVA